MHLCQRLLPHVHVNCIPNMIPKKIVDEIETSASQDTGTFKVCINEYAPFAPTSK